MSQCVDSCGYYQQMAADINCILEGVRLADVKKFPYLIVYLFSKTAVVCVTSNGSFETVLRCGTVCYGDLV